MFVFRWLCALCELRLSAGLLMPARRHAWPPKASRKTVL